MATWNRGVEQIFGYGEREWLGQIAAIIFTEEDQESGVAAREMETAKEQGRSADIRWHRRKDGRRVFLRGVLVALHDEDGTFLGFSKSVVDDTARKDLDDALTQSNADLQQFAFAASHDLQEPLRTLSIYADLLHQRYEAKLDEEGKKMLGALVESSNRMTTLITDLLAYSQLAFQESEVVSVDMNEDWESAVSLLNSTIRTGWRRDYPRSPARDQSGTESAGERLFQNLLGNSIKFRKPGTIPHIHGWAERVGNEWVIRVKDDGIGFRPEQAESIFGPFKRLHSTRHYPGSGIGLATCKRIVEGWGGRIGAESKPGDGSTFWFTLPAS